jgi:hypothetical protein
MTPLAVRFTGSRWAAYVTGPGASRMLRQLRDGRAPDWERGRRAFVVTERVASDLLALADAEGRPVIVTGQPEQAVDQGRLW